MHLDHDLVVIVKPGKPLNLVPRSFVHQATVKGNQMEIRKQGPSATVASFADGAELFYSYETPVAGFIPGLGYFRTDAFFSRTTSKHVGKYVGHSGGRTLTQSTIAALAARAGEGLAGVFADLSQGAV
jgi:hypothetical protein